MLSPYLVGRVLLHYALALTLAGLNHSLLLGVAAGLISFIPYLGSLTGLAVSTCVAIAQFWPNWSAIAVVPIIFLVGPSRTTCCRPIWSAVASICIRCG